MPTKVAGTMSNDLLRTDITTQPLSVGTVLNNIGFNKVFPVGLIMLWYDNVGTEGWLVCNGTVYNIVDYPELGGTLGSLYGGNGTTTFGVPNLTPPAGLSSGSYIIRAFNPAK